MPIEPSLFTAHKTTQRTQYNEVRGSIPLEVEILLQNEKGEISEGCITTPYFWRGGRWVTPPADAGGNLGTTRRWALEQGLAVEETVMAKDVNVGEKIWVSNGVRAWGWGRVG